MAESKATATASASSGEQRESPNGTVVLPQWLVRPLSALAVVAGVMIHMAEDGVFRNALGVFIAICAGLGIYSGGARSYGPNEAPRARYPRRWWQRQRATESLPAKPHVDGGEA